MSHLEQFLSLLTLVTYSDMNEKKIVTGAHQAILKMTKVTELLKNKDRISYSFEVTPDVSEEEIDCLEVDPLFFSVTWHAKSHHCKDMNIAPLQTASMLKSKQKNVLMHMSCDKMKIGYLNQLLVMFQEKNIRNLFLVLGESFDPTSSDFENTSQLIKFIREQTGNYFCIGVAGFPGCSDKKMLHLKDKIESGAEFIITQAFFDIDIYKTFIEQCEKFNIKVPIIPGIFLYESYKQLMGFINLCKVKVSDDLLNFVKTEENVNKTCLEVEKTLLQTLKSEYHVTHFHCFTLNKLQRVSYFIQISCLNESEQNKHFK